MAQLGLTSSQTTSQRLTQSQGLSQEAQLGVRLLAMNLPELRQAIVQEMNQNPVIDYFEPTLESSTVSQKEYEAEESEQLPDYPDDDYDQTGQYSDFTTVDTEAMERRDRLFERQVKEETLSDHLLQQLPMSDIAPRDIPLATTLIDELDANGYFRGTMADIMMISGESEAHIRELLKIISQLDPLGCGATTHQECLLAQISEIADPTLRLRVRALIENHWADMANGDDEKIMRALDIDREEYNAAHEALTTLNPYPGRQYRSEVRGVEFVNPEVHVEKCADGWVAKLDSRSLPEIRISAKYEHMLHDEKTSQEAKEYIQQRIRSINMLNEAIQNRQNTIESIAQALFDAQPGFFEQGLKGLKPLTEQQIAERLGVSCSTVSRTVRDKYASTPKGTIELRKLLVGGFTNDQGEQYTRSDIEAKLQAIIDAEDKTKPLSDDAICKQLKATGFPVARRTVAKYREKLGIAPASRRRIAR